MSIEIPRYEGVIGLPEDGHAIVLTNSEREDLACPHRWWFRHVERLRSPETGPKRFGTLWHSFLEEVHRWWMETDSEWPVGAEMVCPFCHPSRVVPFTGELPLGACARCGGTGQGILARVATDLERAARESESRAGHDAAPRFSREEAAEVAVRLVRAADGWMRKYGRAPYETMQVVGVEVGIARQILNPRTEHAYVPETLLVQLSDGRSRFAATGEASGVVALPEGSEIVSVRWPWYQIGRLDCVLRHRSKPVLYVNEWKSSADPRGLVADLSVDPQTSGYVWLLDQRVFADRFGGEVAGFIYDVTSSSFQADPDQLKGRPTKAEPNPPITFSVAKNRTTPSWRFRDTIRAAGVDEAPYAEHLLYLAAQVDPKLYVREWGSCGDEMRTRYAEEVYATAVRLAALRRATARAEDLTDLTIAVPRVPVCRLPGGGCAFRAPCLLDGDEVRAKFEIGPTLTWG